MREKVVNVKPRKLTKLEKNCVLGWLQLPMRTPDSFLEDFRSTVCPFRDLPWEMRERRLIAWSGSYLCREICEARFDKCRQDDHWVGCPCGNYSTKTVLQRAWEMLEE